MSPACCSAPLEHLYIRGRKGVVDSEGAETTGSECFARDDMSSVARSGDCGISTSVGDWQNRLYIDGTSVWFAGDSYAVSGQRDPYGQNGRIVCARITSIFTQHVCIRDGPILNTTIRSPLFLRSICISVITRLSLFLYAIRIVEHIYAFTSNTPSGTDYTVRTILTGRTNTVSLKILTRFNRCVILHWWHDLRMSTHYSSICRQDSSSSELDGNISNWAIAFSFRALREVFSLAKLRPLLFSFNNVCIVKSIS